MTETDLRAILAGIATDGLEPLGAIDVGHGLVVGDPALLGAEGWLSSTKWGRYHLFLRGAEHDPDEVAELVACHQDVLDRFFDVYDEAAIVAEIVSQTGRVAFLDSRLRDDEALRRSMLEPEELPWVLDQGCVARAPRLGRVFEGQLDGVTVCVSIAFS
jgi:hypothetical protein